MKVKNQPNDKKLANGLSNFQPSEHLLSSAFQIDQIVKNGWLKD